MYPEMEIQKNPVLISGSLSIIIPVFNQQEKISHSIKRIKQAVEPYFTNYELIVVNDGSTDDTLAILKDIVSSDQQQQQHIRILSYTPNRGKGYAVRHGILQSHGDVVMFLDGDLDISPNLIKEYVEKLDVSDLVIASKRHPESNVTVPVSRMIMSRAFNLIVNLATGIHQTDTQAGLKVGKGEIMRTIFRNIDVKRYAFDVELFAIASILQVRIKEMPVIMKIERKFNAKEIVNMFIDLTRIWYKYRITHRYHRQYLKMN
jgi:glycosyltransferase involved in cell wall biosynthesis